VSQNSSDLEISVQAQAY